MNHRLLQIYSERFKSKTRR